MLLDSMFRRRLESAKMREESGHSGSPLDLSGRVQVATQSPASWCTTSIRCDCLWSDPAEDAAKAAISPTTR